MNPSSRAIQIDKNINDPRTIKTLSLSITPNKNENHYLIILQNQKYISVGSTKQDSLENLANSNLVNHMFASDDELFAEDEFNDDLIDNTELLILSNGCRAFRAEDLTLISIIK